MTATDAGRMEEGVYLDPETVELMAYLQIVLEALEAGTADALYADPFTASTLTDAQVDELITAIDGEFAHELGHYMDYHRNRSGAELPPDFARLGPAARRAVAEECQRIMARYPTTKQQAQHEPTYAGDGC